MELKVKDTKSKKVLKNRQSHQCKGQASDRRGEEDGGYRDLLSI